MTCQNPDCVKARAELSKLKKKEKIDKAIPYTDIIEDYRDVFGRDIKCGETNKQRIRKVWAEGYRLPDFEVVHRNRRRANLDGVVGAEDRHLGIGTLYQPTKFEKYRFEAVKPPVSRPNCKKPQLAEAKDNDPEQMTPEENRAAAKKLMQEFKVKGME